MQLLPELFNSTIEGECAKVLAPRADPLSSFREKIGRENAAAAYEIDVFNFLVQEKAALGVSEIWRCRNSRVDGLVRLVNGRTLAVEVKYRMNWEKACQACAQISWYRTRAADVLDLGIDGGLVFFEAFSGYRARRKPTWLLENGWNFWYADHREIDGLPSPPCSPYRGRRRVRVRDLLICS
jgi:hypothetical protein